MKRLPAQQDAWRPRGARVAVRALVAVAMAGLLGACAADRTRTSGVYVGDLYAGQASSQSASSRQQAGALPGMVQNAQGRWVPESTVKTADGMQLSTRPTTDWSALRPAPPAARGPVAPQTISGTAPVASAAIPPASDEVGAGDQLSVSIFGQPELSTEATVSPDGMITLPLIGGVAVAGRSPQHVERLIAAAYQGGGFLLNPQVTVSVAELRSRQVSVLGQVQQPGRFPMASSMTLLDAIALAGGVSDAGGAQVFLLRKQGGGTEKYVLDLDELVAAPGTSGLVALQAGDTVYVPQAPQFFIYGEVRRPDGYALKPGLTVAQAVSLGGGLTDRGSDSRIRIRRTLPDGSTRTLDARKTDLVQEGDVLIVKERFF